MTHTRINIEEWFRREFFAAYLELEELTPSARKCDIYRRAYKRMIERVADAITGDRINWLLTTLIYVSLRRGQKAFINRVADQIDSDTRKTIEFYRVLNAVARYKINHVERKTYDVNKAYYIATRIIREVNRRSREIGKQRPINGRPKSTRDLQRCW
jgi:hypothetical protein